MRTGILANSLPAALKIYDEVKRVRGCEAFVLLCPAPGESSGRGLLKHLARFLLKRGRMKSLRLVFGRRVFIFSETLEHPRTLARLAGLGLDVGLHKAGVIYRESVIKTFRLGILNPHIGMLPEYRGRNVMEWSLLQGDPVGVTVFFIDAGIDTGERIVLREQVDVSHCGSVSEAKQYLFDLDAAFFRRALEILSAGDVRYERNDPASGRRYFVMSKLFLDAVEHSFQTKGKQ